MTIQDARQIVRNQRELSSKYDRLLARIAAHKDEILKQYVDLFDENSESLLAEYGSNEIPLLEDKALRFSILSYWVIAIYGYEPVSPRGEKAGVITFFVEDQLGVSEPEKFFQVYFDKLGNYFTSAEDRLFIDDEIDYLFTRIIEGLHEKIGLKREG